MNYQDLWPLIQQDILGCLQADAFLGARQGVPIEPGDIGDILAAKINKAVSTGIDGKIGAAFLVLPIEEAQDENANLPGGPLRLTIRIQFVENVTLNRGPRGTGTPIRVYAAWAVKVLKLYTPVGLTQSLVPAEPVLHEFTRDDDANLRVGQLKFHAAEADFRPFQRVSRPGIIVTGAPVSSPGSYQLTGPATVAVTAPDADPGQIYYTTDNSHPYQGQPTAQVYNGPVTITAPCLFRVRAFAHNKAGSDTAAANFYQ
ncbi:MAG: chitobiase/beta-hexosaminidase C-terminal domain-containing protein [Verrucomicrobiota bacterium]|jgi:hypothetical protein